MSCSHHWRLDDRGDGGWGGWVWRKGRWMWLTTVEQVRAYDMAALIATVPLLTVQWA